MDYLSKSPQPLNFYVGNINVKFLFNGENHFDGCKRIHTQIVHKIYVITKPVCTNPKVRGDDVPDAVCGRQTHRREV